MMEWFPWRDAPILGAQASCLCIQRTGKMPVLPVPLGLFLYHYSSIPTFHYSILLRLHGMQIHICRDGEDGCGHQVNGLLDIGEAEGFDRAMHVA